jgi:hypothetical protein
MQATSGKTAMNTFSFQTIAIDEIKLAHILLSLAR